MFDVLLAYFERIFVLTKEDEALIKSLFIPASIKKGEFLIREGEMPRYGAFVCRGLLRSYIIDDNGKEHILQFAPENWWISVKPGASEQTSAIFIDAVENSEVLLIDAAGHLMMLEKVRGYATLFHSGIQKRGEVAEKRVVNSLSATAAERYHDFLCTYPTIAQRVPQHMVASYLGITPETISRIRRKAMSKK